VRVTGPSSPKIGKNNVCVLEEFEEIEL